MPLNLGWGPSHSSQALPDHYFYIVHHGARHLTGDPAGDVRHLAALCDLHPPGEKHHQGAGVGHQKLPPHSFHPLQWKITSRKWKDSWTMDILVWGIFGPWHRLSHFWCQGSRGQQSRSAGQVPGKQLRWSPRVQLGGQDRSSCWAEEWLVTNCIEQESWPNPPRVKDRIAARRDSAGFMSDARWQGKFYNSFNAIQSSLDTSWFTSFYKLF